jgi:hypothetical protein
MTCCAGACDGTLCPVCHHPGVGVSRITLQALLTSAALAEGIPPAPRFCGTTDCPVVYFDTSVPVTLDERALSVRVHAKHPDDDDVPVCYCFGITPAIVRTDAQTSSRIRELIKVGRCACEVRNPRGVCCLGDVTAVTE